MAFFSLCKKFNASRSLKIIYSEFHTLKRLESFSLKKRNLAPCVTPKRNFFWIFQRRSKREIRVKDQPPDSYQLIYRNGIDHYFLVGQYGAFFMSVTAAISVAYKSDKWGDTEDTTIYSVDKERPQVVSDYMLGVCSGFIFSICLFYFCMARMPMRIYYYPQQQKYLMYFYGLVPNQIKKQSLYVADIQPVPDKGWAPWSQLLYQHKSGQKIYLFDNYFRYPADLYIMLGWQKDPNTLGYEKLEDKK